jgi:N-acetylneuraminic acid mutarotase
MSAAVLDGIVYVFGGAEVGGEVTDTVYAYDPTKDVWSLVGRLPNAVAGMSATAHEDRIYLFGGSHSSQLYVPKENYYSEAYAFDPVTVTFESLPPMPVARNMAIAGTIGDEIYVIGGMKSPGATACQRYGIKTRSWTIRAEMPLPRGGAVGVTFRFENTVAVFVVGGANQVDVLVYNWRRDEWVRCTSFGVPRNMSFTSVAAASPERIYVIGGANETGVATGTIFIGEVMGEEASE